VSSEGGCFDRSFLVRERPFRIPEIRVKKSGGFEASHRCSGVLLDEIAWGVLVESYHGACHQSQCEEQC